MGVGVARRDRRWAFRERGRGAVADVVVGVGAEWLVVSSGIRGGVLTLTR